MQRIEHEVRGEDGRLLLVEIAGPERGDVVFFHHSTPGSRYRDEGALAEGAARGLRHVSYSRPGYEGSDRNAGRGIGDCGPDLRAIVDQLELERGFVVGESGGGPHALAHAASQPEWVRGVAVVCGSAPFEAEGLDWFRDGVKGNREEFGAVMAGDAVGQKYLEGKIEEIKGCKDCRQLYDEALGGFATEADRESFEREGLGEYVWLVWQRTVAAGLWGWLDDNKALLAPWGFDLDRVEAPVAVWHGEADPVVPLAHGRWVVDHLPNAKLHPLSGKGHGSAMDDYGAILDDLIASGPGRVAV